MRNFRSIGLSSAWLLSLSSVGLYFYSGSLAPLWLMVFISPLHVFVFLGVPLYETRPMGWLSSVVMVVMPVLAFGCMVSLCWLPLWLTPMSMDGWFSVIERDNETLTLVSCLVFNSVMCCRVPWMIYKKHYLEGMWLINRMLWADVIMFFSQPTYNFWQLSKDVMEAPLMAALLSVPVVVLLIMMASMIMEFLLSKKLCLEHRLELEAIKNGLNYEASSGLLVTSIFWAAAQLLILFTRCMFFLL